MRVVAAFLLLSLCSSSLFAWGEKGHGIVNDAATFGTPAELPRFFHDAYPRLVYLGYDPDRWHGAGPSLDAVGFPDHFLDYEYAEGLPLTPKRYDFIHEMERSGRMEQFGISNATSGFVPWRVAELCELLERQWRLWRTADDRIAREQIEQNIIQVAGVLGHYVGDSANPHHSTFHYNGWASAENPQRFRNDCETHARFESVFVTNNIDSSMVRPRVAAVRARGTDYFAVALTFIKESNALVETIYRIDRDGGFTARGTAEGREFAIARLAVGASMLRDLWYSCYLNSATARSRARN